MMEICEVECPDDTSPFDMEESVNDIKYEKRQNDQMALPLLILSKM